MATQDNKDFLELYKNGQTTFLYLSKTIKKNIHYFNMKNGGYLTDLYLKVNDVYDKIDDKINELDFDIELINKDNLIIQTISTSLLKILSKDENLQSKDNFNFNFVSKVKKFHCKDKIFKIPLFFNNSDNYTDFLYKKI